jgi:long-subunit fatty acid transport protein
MKKISLLIFAILSVFMGVTAQNADDALRYSQIFYGGTARFMSMGGAFTALGGDLSAISLNPAGTGVFRSSEISLTPQLVYNSTSSLWNNSASKDVSSVFNLSQIGIVSNILSTGKDKGLVNLNIAYSYNRTNNFTENITISGISNNSSMADYWVSRANGNSKMEIPDDAWAAYQTYLIDTLSGSNNSYGTVFSRYGDNSFSTYGQEIKRVITNVGYTGEHSFSIGANFSNKFYLGTTLGISSLRYTGHLEHFESDVANVIYDFKSFTYTDHLEASGTGFSLKIGTIIKPVEFLRIGLALQSPTVYRITENYYDNISSHFDTQVDGIDHYEYTNNPSSYKYTLTTPLRANAGIALQIKKRAIISADYEFVDYSMSQFSKAIDDQSFSSENSSIREMYKTASNIRLGAELRLSNIYLRGGYSYYGKAFKPSENNKDLDYNSLSFGIGMRHQNYYLDLAFTTLSSKRLYYMYSDPGYLESTTIKTTRDTFAVTFGYKFGI